MFPPSSQNYSNSYIEILAPKSGNLNRVCVDTNNVSAAIGEMRILHMSTSEFVGIVDKDVAVKKSQKIGKAATQNNGYFGDIINGPFGCGVSAGIHTHIKFIANGMNIDGQQIWHYGNYSSFTSQNTSITDPNITNVISQHRMLGGKLSMKVVKRMKAAKSTFGIDKVVIVKR